MRESKHSCLHGNLRKSIEQDFEQMERRLASVPPLASKKFGATPRILSKGFRKNAPEAGLELTVGGITA